MILTFPAKKSDEASMILMATLRESLMQQIATAKRMVRIENTIAKVML